jgi:multiple sugar transport system permease protein
MAHASTFIKTRKNRSLIWFLLPIALYLLFFFLYPLVYDVYISFFDYRLGSAAAFVGLGNYRVMLGDSQFLGSLLTTVIFVVGAVLVEMVFGMIIAVLLDHEHPVMEVIRTIILIPTVFTPLVAGLVWKALYHPDLGMYTYYLRKIGFHIGRGLTVEHSSALLAVILVDVWEWTPLMVIVLLAGLKSVPTEPYEAARLDGANSTQVFFRITLPLLRPTLVVALLIRTLDALKIFDIIWAMTGGGPGTATTVANLRIYEVGMQFLKIGYAATLSNVLLVLGVIAGVFFIQSLYKRKEA